MFGRVRKSRWTILVTTVIGLLSACADSVEKVTDTELQEQALNCSRALDDESTPATQCDQIEKECARRRDQGRFVC